MLIALLYHHALGHKKGSNALKRLEEHFRYIATHYNVLLPGEPLPKGVSLCLTFDDAFFDFYHLIFPLLEKYQLKAVLAVPTAYIEEKTALSPSERLSMISTFSFKGPKTPSASFCTWEELQALSKSPLIEIASHSHFHASSLSADELLLSKSLLEKNLQTPVNTLIYPYGSFSYKRHKQAKQLYRYIFRIGNALNFSWKNTNHLLYRIHGDRLSAPEAPFHWKERLKQGVSFVWNTLRLK